MYRTQVVWLDADELHALKSRGFGEAVGMTLQEESQHSWGFLIICKREVKRYYDLASFCVTDRKPHHLVAKSSDSYPCAGCSI